MTTINITTITEPLSIVLASQDGTYGIQRTDDFTIIALSGTPLLREDALNYYYTFNDPAYDLTYNYSIKIEYESGIYTYVTDTIDGLEIVEEELSWISRLDAELYFQNRLHIDAWEEATDSEKDKSLIMATKVLERLALYDFEDVPDDLKYAICEIALSILEGDDPNKEFENLALTTSQYSSVRSTYDRTYPMEHLEAGVPSIIAWRLIRPFLDVSKGLKLSRVS